MIVVPECKDTGERDESREENNCQRRPSEELGTGCLATRSVGVHDYGQSEPTLYGDFVILM